MNIGLIMDTYNICHNTLNYFLNCIGYELNCLGIQTKKIYDVSELLTGFWNALIMINSSLPAKRMDDGSFLLEHFKCPVFEILVDPPYYHHTVLETHMNNLHIIVLDQGHVEYCKKYYSSFKSINMSYLLGPIGKFTAYEDREIDVLFTGSLGGGRSRQKQCYKKLSYRMGR